jgi:hypothetical protein
LHLFNRGVNPTCVGGEEFFEDFDYFDYRADDLLLVAGLIYSEREVSCGKDESASERNSIFKGEFELFYATAVLFCYQMDVHTPGAIEIAALQENIEG